MSDTQSLLIAAVVRDPEEFYVAISEGVSRNTFTDLCAVEVWETIAAIMADSAALDRYAVITKLKDKPQTLKWFDSIPVDVRGAKPHAQRLRQEEKTRRLKNVVSCYASKNAVTDDDITGLAGDALDILGGGGAHRVHTMADVIPGVLEKADRIAHHKGDNIIGYESFIAQMNQWGVPYPKGLVSVFGAYRGSGKSTIGKQEILHKAGQGISCGLISMEDNAEDAVLNALTVSGAGFMWRYHRGLGDLDRLGLVADKLRQLPVYIIDAPQTIDDWQASAQLLKARYGIEFLVTDHLHHIGDGRGARYGGIEERYTDFMGRICGTTKRLGFAHMLLAQYSRDPEKHDRPPRMSDLRGSGSIEQMARRVYLLRKNPERNEDDGVQWKHFVVEGAKIAQSGFGTPDERQAQIEYAQTHDGFIESNPLTGGDDDV